MKSYKEISKEIDENSTNLIVRPYYKSSGFGLLNYIYDKEDVFDFEIRIDERIVGTRKFTGNVYPQRVRYSVDVRELIPRIISQIQHTLG